MQYHLTRQMFHFMYMCEWEAAYMNKQFNLKRIHIFNNVHLTNLSNKTYSVHKISLLHCAPNKSFLSYALFDVSKYTCSKWIIDK